MVSRLLPRVRVLVDRGILRRRDMRVRDWIGWRYRAVARGVVDRHCISCVPGCLWLVTVGNSVVMAGIGVVTR